MISANSNPFEPVNERANFSPVCVLNTSFTNLVQMLENGETHIQIWFPQTHKNWQQIFWAGRKTWIFHNACQKN